MMDCDFCVKTQDLAVNTLTMFRIGLAGRGFRDIMIPFRMTPIMNLDLKASKASDQLQKLSTVSFTFVGEDWTGVVNSSVSE